MPPSRDTPTTVARRTDALTARRSSNDHSSSSICTTSKVAFGTGTETETETRASVSSLQEWQDTLSRGSRRGPATSHAPAGSSSFSPDPSVPRRPSFPLTTMHSAYAPSHNPAYPYYGQPYHTYIPPGYTQQPPRSTFTAAQPPFTSPPHSTPPDPWSREKVVFPQPNPPRQSPSRDTPFIPSNSDTLDAGHNPKPRLKRASTTKPRPISEKPPLKPALKKNAIKRADSLSAVPLERTRTSSSARHRLAPTTRNARTNSINPSFVPGKCFTHLTLTLLL